MGESIDVWRIFFRTTADTDVFEFIDKAVAIAALDRPKDFLSRRDRIAERLFSCETAAAGGGCALASKECKANGNKFSQGEAETSREDTKETSRVVGEVLRIKQVLDNSRHESDSALHESLRRLRSMNITVDILENIKGWNEALADVKLQAAERKMQGLYQKAETDKRRRTVQLLNLGHLPKTAASHKAPGATTAKACLNV